MTTYLLLLAIILPVAIAQWFAFRGYLNAAIDIGSLYLGITILALAVHIMEV